MIAGKITKSAPYSEYTDPKITKKEKRDLSHQSYFPFGRYQPVNPQ